MILAILFTFGMSVNAQSANDIFMSNFTGTNSYVAPVKKKKKKAPVAVAPAPIPSPRQTTPDRDVITEINAQAPEPASATPSVPSVEEGFKEAPISAAEQEQRSIDEAWDTRMKYWSAEAMKLGGPKEETPSTAVASAADTDVTSAQIKPKILNPSPSDKSQEAAPAAELSSRVPAAEAEAAPAPTVVAEATPKAQEAKAQPASAAKVNADTCKSAVRSRGATKCISDYAGYKCLESSLVSSLQGIGSTGSDGREKSFMVGGSNEQSISIVNVKVQNAIEIKRTGTAPNETMSMISKTWNDYYKQTDEDDVGITNACFTQDRKGHTKAILELDKIDEDTGKNSVVEVTIGQKQMDLKRTAAKGSVSFTVRMDVYTHQEKSLFTKRFEQVGKNRNGEYAWEMGQR